MWQYSGVLAAALTTWLLRRWWFRPAHRVVSHTAVPPVVLALAIGAGLWAWTGLGVLYSPPPSGTTEAEIFIAPEDPATFAELDAVGKKVSVLVKEEGLTPMQRFGIEPRRPTVDILVQIGVKYGRLRDLDRRLQGPLQAKKPLLTWLATIPAGAEEYRLFEHVDTSSKDGKTKFRSGAWRPVPSNEQSVEVPAWFPYRTDPEDDMPDDYRIPVVARIEFRGAKFLSVGRRTEDGQPAELWHLTWAPDEPYVDPGIRQLPPTTGLLDVMGSGPQVRPLEKSLDVHMTVCPSCIPIAAYGDDMTVDDHDQQTKVTNFDTAGTLSFTTYAYPWASIGPLFWVVYGIAITGVVGWVAVRLMKGVVSQLPSVERTAPPSTHERIPQLSSTPWRKNRQR